MNQKLKNGSPTSCCEIVKPKKNRVNSMKHSILKEILYNLRKKKDKFFKTTRRGGWGITRIIISLKFFHLIV